MAKHAKSNQLMNHEKFTNPTGHVLQVFTRANESGEHLVIIETAEKKMIEMGLKKETYIHSLIEAEWYAPAPRILKP